MLKRATKKKQKIKIMKETDVTATVVAEAIRSTHASLVCMEISFKEKLYLI